jgi:hypothetical protein
VSRALIALALAGCGRWGFDPHADGATGDVQSDVGKPCTPVGHDEDLDTIDDACDVCPHLPDVDQTDRDGDFVGDACDPEPLMARQRLVLFDPFVDLSNWTPRSDETSNGDQALLTSLGGFSALRRPYVPMTDLFEIGVIADDVGTGQAIVMVNLDTGTAGNYFCELYDSGTTNLQFTYTFDGTNFVHPGIQPAAHRLEQGDGRLQLQRDATNVRCSASWSGETLVTGGATPAIPADNLVIYAENVTVRISYFVEIRTE